MGEFKGTSGDWQLSFIGNVCIGIEATTEVEGYTQILCNTILPETDKGYAKEKAEIEGNMKMMAASKDMYAALQAALTELQQFIPVTDVKVIDQIESALQKALNG